MRILAVLVLLGCFAEGALAAIRFHVCADERTGTKVIFSAAEGKLNALFRADEDRKVDFIEADNCETKAELSEELRKNISELGNVVGACVTITDDAGNGTIAILRETARSRFSAEIKPIDAETPSQEKGRILACD